VVRRSLALLAVLAVLALAVPASADEQIRAIPMNTYANPDPTIDQGERLTFKNFDPNTHNVTATQEGADHNPLFATREEVRQNQEAFVEGSQYLTTGDYTFFCTFHSFMSGTVHVTSAGTAQPRPGTPGDKTPAAVDVAISRAKLSKVVGRGKLAVEVTVNEPADVDLVAKLGRKTVAQGSSDLDTGTKKVNLRLTRAGKRTLKRRSSAKLVVTVDAKDKNGNESSDTATRRLRG
jgi:plastocyanin